MDKKNLHVNVDMQVNCKKIGEFCLLGRLFFRILCGLRLL